MTNLYSILIFLISSASMLSGLIAAPLGTALFGSIIVINYRKIDFMRIKSKKIELIFFSWIFLSCIWSISGFPAFTKFFIILFFFISLIVATDDSLYNSIDKYKIFAIPLILGCLAALIFFLIEYRTVGYLTKGFRNIFQASHRHLFALYFLDRGCSVLSMFSWPVIYVLCKKRKWIFALVYTILVGYILSISDSLASYLAFILGICTFIVLFLSRMYFTYIIMCGIIFCAIAMPIFSYYQIPRELCQAYPSIIPDSGKHRLFIWKFTAGKAMEKLPFGWGFDAAPNIPVDEETEVIYLKQYKWYPLPLHPHNSFMQIWLECGLVGLCLFVGILLKMQRRIFSIARKNSDILWGALAGACFINYWFIAMLSYGMWQMWWVATIAISILFFSIFRKIDKTKSQTDLI